MGQVPGILRLALIYGIIVNGIYGLLLAFVPTYFAMFMGSGPVEAIWQRWAGGVLLALAFGQFRVLMNPAKQDIFVVTMILASLFTGLGILFSYVMHEYSAYEVWVILPIVLTLVQAILLFLARQTALKIL